MNLNIIKSNYILALDLCLISIYTDDDDVCDTVCDSCICSNVQKQEQILDFKPVK